jgi:hypothetical protein
VPWLKVCDTALTHPKVIAIHNLGDAVVTGEAVIGAIMLASSWSGQHLTDCFIPDYIGRIASPLHWDKLAAAALKAKIVKKARKGGVDGWSVLIGEGEIFHLLSKEHVLRTRAKRAFTRTDAAQIEALLRDGDECRYCDRPVHPMSRGLHSRQMDHPDPAIKDVVVTACQECNNKKQDRTPREAGMTLLLPPKERGWDLYLTEHSVEWLTRKGALPDSYSTKPAPRRAGAANPLQPAASAPATPPAESLLPPGRDGSGLPVPTPAGTSRASPPGQVSRPRGSRGGRRKRKPPPTLSQER